MTKILEVNEDGALVIPADLLNGAEPHQRYTAESAGKNLVLTPESDHARRQKPQKLTSEEWEVEWKAFTEKVTQAWPTGVSAVDAVSEIRR